MQSNSTTCSLQAKIGSRGFGILDIKFMDGKIGYACGGSGSLFKTGGGRRDIRALGLLLCCAASRRCKHRCCCCQSTFDFKSVSYCSKSPSRLLNLPLTEPLQRMEVRPGGASALPTLWLRISMSSSSHPVALALCWAMMVCCCG